MSLLVFIGVLASGLVAGAFIGAVGVGGVLLTPLLLTFTDIDLHSAMAAASFSFLFTGVMGSAAYARRGSVPWLHAVWLSLGVMPAALLGARINSLMPTSVLALLLALLLVAAVLNALRPTHIDGAEPINLSWLGLVLLGLAVGFGSALTGTGGAVLLVPLLLLLRMPPLPAIGIAQVIQLPIAVFATIGYALYGNLDLVLGTLLGVSQAVAVLAGAQLAHMLPTKHLRRAVAVALITAACALGARSFTS